MAEELAESRGAAQVNWLVAGRFGLPERGATLSLTRADFNDALERQKLEVRARVPDRIGAGETREVSLAIDSLKQLSLKHVVGALPELSALLQKAEQAAKLKEPSAADLEGLVGPGKLLDALLGAIAPAGGETTAGGEATATGDVDAIFERASVPERSAKSAIDMFVRGTSTSRPKPKPAARKLRDLIEQTVYAAASDVLRSPEVDAFETAWRGLRFLVSQCPKDAGMCVTVLETDPDHLVEDLGRRERGDDIDEPDCVFVVHDFDSTAPLTELADFAEQELIPIVVGVRPSLFGATALSEVPDVFEALERAQDAELPAWASEWDDLRVRESSRWLAAVANRVALHGEGAGDAKRTVFASGVWGLASMVAASFAATGGFARIFGKSGSLHAPASHTIDRGSYKDTAAPTEAFYAINACELLSKNGLLGLGSVRNSDTLALVKAPMVRGATDAVPLPAQILTGRVVRFASWVKAQLPEGCDSKTANEIFTSAASVFLFPGQEDAAHMRAATTNIEGEAHVIVRAAANPQIASIPFEIAFPLPLGWSVPAPESEPSEEAGPSAPPSDGDVAEVQGEPAKGAEGVGLGGSSVGFDADIGKSDEE